MGQKIHPVGFRLNITQSHRSVWSFPPHERSHLLLEDKAIRDYLFKKYTEAQISEIFIRRVTPTRIRVDPKGQYEEHHKYHYVYIHIYAGKSFLIAPYPPRKPKKKKFFRKKPWRPRPRKTLKPFASKKVPKPVSSTKKSAPYVMLTPRQFSLRRLSKQLKNLLNPQRRLPLRPLAIIVNVSPLAEFQPKAYTTQASSMAFNLIAKLQDRKPFRPAVKKLFSDAKDIPGLRVQVSGRLNGAEIARSEWAKKGRVPLHTLSANIDYVYKTAKTIYGILGIKIWTFKTSQICPYSQRNQDYQDFVLSYLRVYKRKKYRIFRSFGVSTRKKVKRGKASKKVLRVKDQGAGQKPSGQTFGPVLSVSEGL